MSKKGEKRPDRAPKNSQAWREHKESEALDRELQHQRQKEAREAHEALDKDRRDHGEDPATGKPKSK